MCLNLKCYEANGDRASNSYDAYQILCTREKCNAEHDSVSNPMCSGIRINRHKQNPEINNQVTYNGNVCVAEKCMTTVNAEEKDFTVTPM